MERVGRHDNFFELGGHSLSAIRLMLRIQQDTGVQITIGKVFKFAQFSLLAEQIVDTQLTQFDPEELARLAKTLPNT